MSDIRIGISGWRYPPWRGTFFPKGLRQKDELAYASSHLRSIEINGTFYSLQTPSSFGTWHDATPDDFIFSVKGPRFITHIKRLRDFQAPLANFLGSGVLRLGTKLGPILWQLPPSFHYHREILDSFLSALPRTTGDALKLARKHDRRLRTPWLRKPPDAPLRHAIEIRHESFRNAEFVRLLRRQRIALVVADTAGKWPLMADVTADFVYVRLHGDAALYVSGYGPAALDRWAARIRAWARGAVPRGSALSASPVPPRRGGRDVFVYFDNDVKVRAPFDAQSLAHRLGLGAAPSRPPPLKSIPERPRGPTSWPGFRRTHQPRRKRRKQGATVD